MNWFDGEPCTGFPNTWLGVDLTECCKNHDNNLGTHSFYKCLKAKIGWFHAGYITLGGAVGAWIKYTKTMAKKV